MGQVTDYSPGAENPRDCCANLAMTFREFLRGDWTPHAADWREWADRLERAVQQLDAERNLAPNLRSLFETYGEHMEECERPTLATDAGCTCGFTENLARVRSLIPYHNQGAVPPAEQDTPQ